MLGIGKSAWRIRLWFLTYLSMSVREMRDSPSIAPVNSREDTEGVNDGKSVGNPAGHCPRIRPANLLVSPQALLTFLVQWVWDIGPCVSRSTRMRDFNSRPVTPPHPSGISDSLEFNCHWRRNSRNRSTRMWINEQRTNQRPDAGKHTAKIRNCN